MNWSPYSKKLDLEIAGKPSVNEEYIIKNNDMYLWEVKPQIGYETQFLDSTLTIKEDITLPSIKDNVNIQCPNVNCNNDGESNILYVKYDTNSMKYMYICTHCNHKWTNN